MCPLVTQQGMPRWWIRSRDPTAGWSGGEAPEPYSRTTASDPGPERSKHESTKDRHTAFPDIQRLEKVLAGTEIVVRVGDHVEDASANDAKRYCPQCDIENDSGVCAALFEAVTGENGGRDNSGKDAQCVSVNVDLVTGGHAKPTEPFADGNTQNLPVVGDSRGRNANPA